MCYLNFFSKLGIFYLELYGVPSVFNILSSVSTNHNLVNKTPITFSKVNCLIPHPRWLNSTYIIACNVQNLDLVFLCVRKFLEKCVIFINVGFVNMFVYCAHIHFLAGLVVPDVPLEETEVLRKEAVKHNIELVISFSHNGCIYHL